ncbi:MAG: DNA-binding protein WhiA [Eggerthellaceae bacterium]|nr:DNA-binding protein WhiA [Eggerthellaceae bacterium]
MSFSVEVKEELINVEPNCSNCARSCLAAICRIKGTLYKAGEGSFRLQIRTDNSKLARYVIKSLREKYLLETNYSIRESRFNSGTLFYVNIPHQEELNAFLQQVGILDKDNKLLRGIPAHLYKNECCGAAYHRGCFLGSGYVSEPTGKFHFEITLNNKPIARDMIEILAQKGIDTKVISRGSKYVLYLKKAQSIIDFFAYIGAHVSLLKFEEYRVIKSAASQSNRLANCEFSNILKSTAASLQQIKEIHTVLDNYNINKLPKGLEEYIRVRSENPELSLSELGKKFDPAISKSAVYHRVRRISELCSKYKLGNYSFLGQSCFSPVSHFRAKTAKCGRSREIS